MTITPDLFVHSKIRPQAPIYCVYHRVDFDGECSAALVARNTVGCEFIPYNYNEPFPWNVFVGADRRPICYMVDVSLPIPDMRRLAGLSELVWIDHHSSKISEAQAANFNPPGVRDSKFAACELTWGHFHGNNVYMPIAVHLLGRYDAWDHKDTRVMPFQFWMRGIQSTKPQEVSFWDNVLDMYETGENFKEALNRGFFNWQYQAAQDYKNITRYGFETRMFGFKTLACNSLPGGSQLFTAHPDVGDYPLFCMFYWRDRVGWTISLYTEGKHIDCGDIARRMGGGGHQSAAGYTVSVLPEELQHHHDDSHIKGIY